ncbi:unnamed protein product [Amoebophrya sp. A120]|nr:unnamed protein product [Amoebophrya sp. A120]|eukprot:GSA120T00011580001.1
MKLGRNHHHQGNITNQRNHMPETAGRSRRGTPRICFGVSVGGRVISVCSSVLAKMSMWHCLFFFFLRQNNYLSQTLVHAKIRTHRALCLKRVEKIALDREASEKYFDFLVRNNMSDARADRPRGLKDYFKYYNTSEDLVSYTATPPSLAPMLTCVDLEDAVLFNQEMATACSPATCSLFDAALKFVPPKSLLHSADGTDLTQRKVISEADKVEQQVLDNCKGEDTRQTLRKTSSPYAFVSVDEILRGGFCGKNVDDGSVEGKEATTSPDWATSIVTAVLNLGSRENNSEEDYKSFHLHGPKKLHTYKTNEEPLPSTATGRGTSSTSSLLSAKVTESGEIHVNAAGSESRLGQGTSTNDFLQVFAEEADEPTGHDGDHDADAFFSPTASFFSTSAEVLDKDEDYTHGSFLEHRSSRSAERKQETETSREKVTKWSKRRASSTSSRTSSAFTQKMKKHRKSFFMDWLRGTKKPPPPHCDLEGFVQAFRSALCQDVHRGRVGPPTDDASLVSILEHRAPPTIQLVLKTDVLYFLGVADLTQEKLQHGKEDGSRIYYNQPQPGLVFNEIQNPHTVFQHVFNQCPVRSGGATVLAHVNPATNNYAGAPSVLSTSTSTVTVPVPYLLLARSLFLMGNPRGSVGDLWSSLVNSSPHSAREAELMRAYETKTANLWQGRFLHAVGQREASDGSLLSTVTGDFLKKVEQYVWKKEFLDSKRGAKAEGAAALKTTSTPQEEEDHKQLQDWARSHPLRLLEYLHYRRVYRFRLSFSFSGVGLVMGNKMVSEKESATMREIEVDGIYIFHPDVLLEVLSDEDDGDEEVISVIEFDHGHNRHFRSAPFLHKESRKMRPWTGDWSSWSQEVGEFSASIHKVFMTLQYWIELAGAKPYMLGQWNCFQMAHLLVYMLFLPLHEVNTDFHSDSAFQEIQQRLISTQAAQSEQGQGAGAGETGQATEGDASATDVVSSADHTITSGAAAPAGAVDSSNEGGNDAEGQDVPKTELLSSTAFVEMKTKTRPGARLFHVPQLRSSGKNDLDTCTLADRNRLWRAFLGEIGEPHDESSLGRTAAAMKTISACGRIDEGSSQGEDRASLMSAQVILPAESLTLKRETDVVENYQLQFPNHYASGPSFEVEYPLQMFANMTIDYSVFRVFSTEALLPAAWSARLQLVQLPFLSRFDSLGDLLEMAANRNGKRFEQWKLSALRYLAPAVTDKLSHWFGDKHGHSVFAIGLNREQARKGITEYMESDTLASIIKDLKAEYQDLLLFLQAYKTKT